MTKEYDKENMIINTDIIKAEKSDLPEILKLQYLAYQSEAALFGSKDIPPLKETLSEVEKQFENGTILKMIDENKVVVPAIKGAELGSLVYISCVSCALAGKSDEK